MDAIAIRLAERVKKLRLQTGLTQAELAARAGVTVETVARLERVVRGRASANANPSLETLARLGDALGVTVVDLLSQATKKAAGSKDAPKDDRLASVMRAANDATKRVVLRVAEVLVREQAAQSPQRAAARRGARK